MAAGRPAGRLCQLRSTGLRAGRERQQVGGGSGGAACRVRCGGWPCGWIFRVVPPTDRQHRQAHLLRVGAGRQWREAWAALEVAVAY